jgi:REP element-mobilizing transposase RayT
MSWTRIFVHLIFSTKDRTAYLNTPELRRRTFTHIKQNATLKNIWLDCVNGYADHAHCLLALGKSQSIGELAHLIKGESSFWINRNHLISGKFKWQDDYWAISVSEQQVESLRDYIYHQEGHHQSVNFADEIQEIIRSCDGLHGAKAP